MVEGRRGARKRRGEEIRGVPERKEAEKEGNEGQAPSACQEKEEVSISLTTREGERLVLLM